MEQRTLIILKPDCLQRGIIGEIITRFEKKGIKIVAMKLIRITNELAIKHYAEHKGKPFYDNLISFITSDPVIVMILQADEVISITRKIVGATEVKDAIPGTIRGDYIIHTPKNIIHASDSEENAKKEIKNFFSENEIIDYEKDIDKWI